jgi:hypothetical protein
MGNALILPSASVFRVLSWTSFSPFTLPADGCVYLPVADPLIAFGYAA